MKRLLHLPVSVVLLVLAMVGLVAVGCAGPAGQQGAQGVQGIQGVPGEPGLPGLPGAAGLPGLQGPQGQTGPQGATGTQGPQGATGPTSLASIALGASYIVNAPTTPVGDKTCPAPARLAGATVEVLGSGFIAGEYAAIFLVSDTGASPLLVGNDTANDGGAFRASVTLPSYGAVCTGKTPTFSRFSGVAPGVYSVEARGENDSNASAPVVVVAEIK